MSTDTLTRQKDPAVMPVAAPGWGPFRSWLASRPKDEVIGRSNCASSCPLATWLKASQGFDDVLVWKHGFSAGGGDLSGYRSRLVNSLWWQEFIEAVDWPAGWEEVYTRPGAQIDLIREVTAGEALYLLDTIVGHFQPSFARGTQEGGIA